MTEKFIKVTDDFWVSPQLSADDIAAAANEGFKLIINNRPDGEMIGQPNGDDLRAAAETAGIGYAHIPVSGGLSMEQIEQERDAQSTHPGKTLAFCGSGMRSAFVYAYMAARNGEAVDDIVTTIANAGFDVSAHHGALQSLSEASK